jgi:hypothetical protein
MHEDFVGATGIEGTAGTRWTCTASDTLAAEDLGE